MPGFRICAHDECDSLGDLSDEEEHQIRMMLVPTRARGSLLFPTKAR